MLKEIEDALITRLTGSALNGHLKTVASYTEVLKEIEENRMTKPLPGVFVMYTGGPFEKVTQKYKHECAWSFVVVVKDLVSDKSRRRKNDVGAYSIISALLALFTGKGSKELSVAITPMIPRGITPIYNQELEKKGISLYDLKFSTSFVIEPVAEETLDDLLTVNLQYFLQEPADDGVKDAEDQVVLDQ